MQNPTPIIPAEKGEDLNEFINKVGRDTDEQQSDNSINLTNTKFPREDSNVGDNPIYPDSNLVMANDGTADPHSDRSKEDRGEDNPQDIDSTDEAVEEENINDKSQDKDRLGNQSVVDEKDESLDNMVNIDERGGSDGESETHIDRQSGEDPEGKDENDDEIVTRGGI